MTYLRFQPIHTEKKSDGGPYSTWMSSDVKELERSPCCDLDSDKDISGSAWYCDKAHSVDESEYGPHSTHVYALGDDYEYQEITSPKFCYNCGVEHVVVIEPHVVRHLVTKTRTVMKTVLKEVEVPVEEEYTELETD